MTEAGEAQAARVPLGDALAQAERCRSEGRLIEAEAICRQILGAQPTSPEAEHLLGVVMHQSGRLGEAIEHVQRAIKLAPKVALFHANVGEMLRLAGRPRLAVEAAQRAIAIDPHMPAALSNLGVALYELKDYEEAAGPSAGRSPSIPTSPRRTAISAMPCSAARFDEAIDAYRRAVASILAYAEPGPISARRCITAGLRRGHVGLAARDRAGAAIMPTPFPGSAFFC